MQQENSGPIAQRITISCNFNGQITPVQFYIGEPREDYHPIHHQAEWLSKNRGGSVAPEVMENIKTVSELAKKYHVQVSELLSYALASQERNSKEKSAAGSERSAH